MDAKKLHDEISERLGDMEPAKKAITEKQIEEYVWLCEQIEGLENQIEIDGPLIDSGKGTLKENPAVGVIHKLSGRKEGLYAKLMRYLPDDSNGDDDDDLADFMRG